MMKMKMLRLKKWSPKKTIKNFINSTTEYLIHHDRKELMELLKDFQDGTDGDYMEKVLKPEELIDIFLDDEYLDGQPIIPMIDDLSKKLESFPMSRSRQHRLKMLSNDIQHNRYWV